MKNCCKNDCSQQNPQDLSCFHKDARRKDNLRSECKSCVSKKKYKRPYTEKDKEYKKIYNNLPLVKQSLQDYKLKKKYGISLKERYEMAAEQGFKCNICNIPENKLGKKGLCVDHDHKTNKVRGLLCNDCNVGLGLFEDNVEFINNAISYLGKYEKDE